MAPPTGHRCFFSGRCTQAGSPTQPSLLRQLSILVLVCCLPTAAPAPRGGSAKAELQDEGTHVRKFIRREGHNPDLRRHSTWERAPDERARGSDGAPRHGRKRRKQVTRLATADASESSDLLPGTRSLAGKGARLQDDSNGEQAADMEPAHSPAIAAKLVSHKSVGEGGSHRPLRYIPVRYIPVHTPTADPQDYVSVQVVATNSSQATVVIQQPGASNASRQSRESSWKDAESSSVPCSVKSEIIDAERARRLQAIAQEQARREAAADHLQPAPRDSWPILPPLISKVFRSDRRRRTPATSASASSTLSTKTTTTTYLCPFDGVFKHDRCWYLSQTGESCTAACDRNKLSFVWKFVGRGVVLPIMPQLRRPSGAWLEPLGPISCSKPDASYHTELAGNFTDAERGAWSDASCQLACPCSSPKECRASVLGTTANCSTASEAVNLETTSGPPLTDCIGRTDNNLNLCRTNFIAGVRTCVATSVKCSSVDICTGVLHNHTADGTCASILNDEARCVATTDADRKLCVFRAGVCRASATECEVEAFCRGRSLLQGSCKLYNGNLAGCIGSAEPSGHLCRYHGGACFASNLRCDAAYLQLQGQHRHLDAFENDGNVVVAASVDYHKEEGVSCGHQGACRAELAQDDLVNRLDLGAMGEPFDAADSAEEAAAVCLAKCSSTPECRGAVYNASSRLCLYKQNTRCGRSFEDGAVCFTKAEEMQEFSQPRPNTSWWRFSGQPSGAKCEFWYGQLQAYAGDRLVSEGRVLFEKDENGTWSEIVWALEQPMSINQIRVNVGGKDDECLPDNITVQYAFDQQGPWLPRWRQKLAKVRYHWQDGHHPDKRALLTYNWVQKEGKGWLRGCTSRLAQQCGVATFRSALQLCESLTQCVCVSWSEEQRCAYFAAGSTVSPEVVPQAGWRSAYIGFAAGPQNVAKGARVTMSSELLFRGGGGASLVTDGQTCGSLHCAVAHTRREFEAWVHVDLGEHFLLEKIVLWNGLDDAREFDINPFAVICDGRNYTWQRRGLRLEGQPFLSLPGPDEAVASIRVQLDGHANSLHLAEIEAFAQRIEDDVVGNWTLNTSTSTERLEILRNGSFLTEVRGLDNLTLLHKKQGVLRPSKGVWSSRYRMPSARLHGAMDSIVSAADGQLVVSQDRGKDRAMQTVTYTREAESDTAAPLAPEKPITYTIDSKKVCGQCSPQNRVLGEVNATPEQIMTSCAPVCNAERRCGGFDFNRVRKSCVFYKDTYCGDVSPDAATDCYTKEPVVELYDFIRYAGQECRGAKPDMLSYWQGTAEECARQCMSMRENCTAFVRVHGYGWDEATKAAAALARKGLNLTAGWCHFRADQGLAPLQFPDSHSQACYLPKQHSVAGVWRIPNVGDVNIKQTQSTLNAGAVAETAAGELRGQTFSLTWPSDSGVAEASPTSVRRMFGWQRLSARPYDKSETWVPPQVLKLGWHFGFQFLLFSPRICNGKAYYFADFAAGMPRVNAAKNANTISMALMEEVFSGKIRSNSTWKMGAYEFRIPTADEFVALSATTGLWLNNNAYWTSERSATEEKHKVLAMPINSATYESNLKRDFLWVFHVQPSETLLETGEVSEEQNVASNHTKEATATSPPEAVECAAGFDRVDGSFAGNFGSCDRTLEAGRCVFQLAEDAFDVCQRSAACCGVERTPVGGWSLGACPLAHGSDRKACVKQTSSLWTLGQPGESCTESCAGAGKACSEAAFADRLPMVNTTSSLAVVVGSMGRWCRSFKVSSASSAPYAEDLPNSSDASDLMCHVSTLPDLEKLNCAAAPVSADARRLCWCDSLVPSTEQAQVLRAGQLRAGKDPASCLTVVQADGFPVAMRPCEEPTAESASLQLFSLPEGHGLIRLAKNDSMCIRAQLDLGLQLAPCGVDSDRRFMFSVPLTGRGRFRLSLRSDYCLNAFGSGVNLSQCLDEYTERQHFVVQVSCWLPRLLSSVR
eukprot:TRINITY_DN33895_c0_g2_i2.p1 TRINITY_DN33895_c0_g2~~TRINITY_DN33895_c0_g2_i2.p1  ORF type:complete len:1958 (-),score=302.23 TRINITY_DN33895_c0_g2_i2:411-6284(-)